MDLEELKVELKEKYLYKPENEKRFVHSLGVMEISEELAKRYNTDIQRTKKSALMHDMAKVMPVESLREYIKENNLQVSENEMLAGVALHGIVAADICKKKYNFDDEMCEAIACHTIGKEDMTILEKVIFIADKIDKTRTYEGIEDLRKLAFEDIDRAIIQNIENSIEKSIRKGTIIIERSIKTRNFILINLKK